MPSSGDCRCARSRAPRGSSGRFASRSVRSPSPIRSKPAARSSTSSATSPGRKRPAGSETLFVIHPDRHAISATELEGFVVRLDRRLQAVPRLAGLRVFEAHPESEFQVGDVYTRRGPYPSFQVLSHARLKATSDTLRGAGYYDRFTPAMLRAVGMPR